MFLIFDTETTTFPSARLTHNDPNQARICQLGALLLDENFQEIDHINTLIKPNGWDKISDGAYGAHGISIQQCEEEGRLMIEVIDEYINMMYKSKLIICHNYEFDSTMFGIEFANYKTGQEYKSPEIHGTVCTMSLMTDICKLPFPGGRKRFGQKYKWPKLEEAYWHLFKEQHVEAHNALADCRATARIFRWLWENGHIKGKEEIATIV